MTVSTAKSKFCSVAGGSIQQKEVPYWQLSELTIHTAKQKFYAVAGGFIQQKKVSDIRSGQWQNSLKSED